MLKLTAPGRAVFEKKGCDSFAAFIQDAKLARLARADDCLVNRDEIKIREIAAQLLADAGCSGRAGLLQSESHLLTQKEKKSGYPARNCGKILALKTLDADQFLRPGGM